MVDVAAGSLKYVAFVSGKTAVGSGVLYYPGDEYFYVFTCAHVVAQQEGITVYFLDHADNLESVIVPESEIYVSPLYQGEDDSIEDIAIIRARIPVGTDIPKSEYYVCDPSRNDIIYFQGFPGADNNSKNLQELIDELNGRVLHSLQEKNNFIVRITDTFLDQSGRIEELLGYSGSPVWLYKDAYYLEGLIVATQGSNASLNKIRAIKSERIRSLLQDRFGEVINRKIPGIPETDIAHSEQEIRNIAAHRLIEIPTLNDQWLDEQIAAARALLDDLQLQKTIDLLKDTANQEQFLYASRDKQKHVLQFLLYCYEIADLDQDFDDLEKWMNEKGYIHGYDPLRRLTRTFSRRNYLATIEAAEKYLNDPTFAEDTRLQILSKVFLLLSRAYTEDLSESETIGLIVDSKEQLIVETDDPDTNALICQMVGYTYGEHYHNYRQSVRYLNHAYSFGSDSMVLESLGSAYYFLGIQNATNEEGYVDNRLIDVDSLNKARSAFLSILSEADELFLSGTYKRLGVVIFNTFYFLHDTYRTITTYPYVRKYSKLTEPKDIRDVERKYASYQTLSGEFDPSKFTQLTKQDELYLQCIAAFSYITAIIDTYSRQRLEGVVLENDLKNIIALHERAINEVDSKDELQLRINLINLYSDGIL